MRRLATGEEQWSTAAVGGATALSDGTTVVLFNEQGTLILAKADPTEYHELARAPILPGEVSWTLPAYSRDRLLVRGRDHVACVLLDAAASATPAAVEAAREAILERPSLDLVRAWAERHHDTAFWAPAAADLVLWFTVCIAAVFLPAWLLARPVRHRAHVARGLFICQVDWTAYNRYMAERLSPDASASWRLRLHEVIFEADTAAGKAFDVALLVAIVLSVAAVSLESVATIRERIGPLLRATEWFFTILFTIEYVLRLICVGRPAAYARSFFGIVDLLAIVPTYISVVVTGTQSLLVIRALRLLRAFRVFKVAHLLSEARVLMAALRASRPKITVFLGTVLTIVVIVGATMYLVEGEASGFTSIPRSVYWAIVTLTTVGYGDIAPQTVLGQALAAVVMILGYGIIAVPTGIVSVELSRAHDRHISTQACPQCAEEGHDADAEHCKYCGARL